MPKVNLSGMTIEALMELRERVDEMLLKRRAELEKQLARMYKPVGGASTLKGKKVPPKYRGPSGNLGRSWRKTSMACCCAQRRKEA